MQFSPIIKNESERVRTYQQDVDLRVKYDIINQIKHPWLLFVPLKLDQMISLYGGWGHSNCLPLPEMGVSI